MGKEKVINQEVEEWRPILGHEDYEVSSYGRIRSYRISTTGRLLTPHKDKDGYFYISLGSDYRTKVHRLVLETFVKLQPSAELVCRHLDGNRTNNHFSNLCWGTLAENYNDRRFHGTAIAGARNPRAKLTETQANEIKLSKLTNQELAVKYDVGTLAIWRIKTGRTWSKL